MNGNFGYDSLVICLIHPKTFCIFVFPKKAINNYQIKNLIK